MAEKKEDPFKILVDVQTEKARQDEEKRLFVSVNARNMLVPLDGKVHKIPKPFAEVLINRSAAQDEAEKYSEEKSDKPSKN